HSFTRHATTSSSATPRTATRNQPAGRSVTITSGDASSSTACCATTSSTMPCTAAGSSARKYSPPPASTVSRYSLLGRALVALRAAEDAVQPDVARRDELRRLRERVDRLSRDVVVGREDDRARALGVLRVELERAAREAVADEARAREVGRRPGGELRVLEDLRVVGAARVVERRGVLVERVDPGLELLLDERV